MYFKYIPPDVNTLLQGHVLDVLRTLPDEHVQCCVTSPPYFRLRSYLPDTHPSKHLEIGQERTPDEYVAKLVEVFREVRRVLRKDGTLWIVIGDTYASDRGYQVPDSKWRDVGNGRGMKAKDFGVKPKDLLGIPWMVAFALRSDGWWLRSDIVWNKPNCMPGSMQDRPTKSHEYVFLLSRSERYFYDAEAIREDAVHSGKIIRLGTKSFSKRQADGAGRKPSGNGSADTYLVPGRRNKRTVWDISTRSYAGAHFAVFPPDLVEPMILAGTSPRACEHCRMPWKRVIVPTGHVNKREPAHAPDSAPTKTDSTGWAPTRMATDEWKPICSCENEGRGKCVVLDPFAGAGTALLVAAELGRDWLGIELNEDYVTLAEDRMNTETEVPA